MSDSLLDRYTNTKRSSFAELVSPTAGQPPKAATTDPSATDTITPTAKLPAELIEAAEGVDAAEEHHCFGVLRGVRERALMLELRKKDGAILAVSYSYLERATFDPHEGITLVVMSKSIRITGRNLNAEIRPGLRLFQAIARHRVTWVGEQGSNTDLDGEGARVEVAGIGW